MSDVFYNPAAIGENVGLEVRFVMRAVKDEAETLKEGRAVYKNVEFVCIRGIGERDEVVRKVTQSDKEKFAAAYIRFKATQEVVVEGFPLENWPLLDTAQVLELKELGIRTVEELSEKTTHLHRFVEELAIKAKDFLSYASDNKDSAKLVVELEELRAENRRLTEKVRKLEQAHKRGKDVVED